MPGPVENEHKLLVNNKPRNKETEMKIELKVSQRMY